MRFLILLILTMFFQNNLNGQLSCLQIFEEAEKSVTKGEFRDAILKFQAAKKCDESLSQQTDEKILTVFDKIEALKTLAERERKKAEDNKKRMAQLLDKITEIIQKEEVQAIVGLAPLENEIYQLLLPNYEFIEKNSNNAIWGNARVHYRLGVTLEKMGESGIEEYKNSYELSTSAIEELHSKKQKAPKELYYTLMNSAYYYSWALISKKEFKSADLILQKTIKLTQSATDREASFYKNLAGLENSLSRLYKQIDRHKEALESNHRAIQLSEKAVELDSTSISNQIALAAYNRNMQFNADSLISREEQAKYRNEGCDLLYSMREKKGMGALGLQTFASCAYDYAQDHISEGEYDEALLLLEDAVQQLSTVLELDTLGTHFYLHRARLSERISHIYQKQKKESKSLTFAIKSKNDWVDAVKYGKLFPYDLWMFRSVYDKYRYVPERIKEKEDKLLFVKDITSAVEKLAESYQDIPEINFVAGDAFRMLGAELHNQKSNYNVAMKAIRKSIKYFSASNFLDDISKFKEEYEWIARAYLLKFSTNHRFNFIQNATKDYEKFYEVNQPVLDKYPFDFYLHIHFMHINRDLGDLYFQKEKYQEAIPYLEYASKWNQRESTLQLAEIYKKGWIGNQDIPKADALEKLASKQSMKKFTIPCDFGKEKIPFDFYVIQSPKDFIYKGIDNQSQWLLKARGGVIPENARNAFIKLQKLAWEKDKSYPDYCVLALNLADQGDIDKLEMKFDSTEILLEKQQLFQSISGKYKTLIRRDSSKIRLGYQRIKDSYISYLTNSGELESAEEMIQQEIQDDPNRAENFRLLAKIHIAKYEKRQEEAKQPMDILSSNSIAALGEYHRSFLRKNELENAMYFQNRLLDISDSKIMRFALLRNQMTYDVDQFSSLYHNITDEKELEANITYFYKELIKEKDRKTLIKLYDYITQLDQQLLALNKNSEFEMANHYNSKAWHEILDGQFEIAETSLKDGIKIDKEYPYFYTNLPSVMLLQGKFKKAKKLYKKYKDVPFNRDPNYATYKEIFLEDLQVFEKEGIIPEARKSDVQKIIKLLND